MSFYLIVRPATPAKATVLFCHGWMSNAESTLDIAKMFATRCGVAVLIVDMPGHGYSTLRGRDSSDSFQGRN